jgi:succinate-semialdehyde dehydrogenase / glutarate-semialdehyde dehydrogenase
LEAMKQVVEKTLAAGAKMQTGGARIGTTGNFFEPTVFTDVPLTADLFNNEPFGPLVGIRGFDTIEEAITESNRLPYGLSSYAFTKSLKTAHAISHGIEAGMVWINQPAAPVPEMPFGGVKDSGYGSEGGMEALEAYLNTKTVSTVMV